ncbi:SNF2-related protein [Brevibacillus laterosporus]|uniref:DEAD/DEAH box helicase n=1 Tax=Brevibacillus laterosporus TaxID=1465 RepID=UPI00037CDCC9|nr:SNF2-related protein [Brevibacillus laterosporus]ATO50875.1 ATP-dependent helicase [Brevibacillus laterosporus DSM 25]MBG9804538.1 ATP-dependent helicase [Brevibacillus laterosporus]MED2002950.1 SNF2-related protein [Brevibacillus laterosporus]MED4763930.1 SNF2-related protein [Brevibacillus laterosporus]TPH16968.1 DEAD/DEAH box helicase [Brevibacillus laterosporus]
MTNFSLSFDTSWAAPLEELIQQDGPWNKWELFQLALQAEEAMAVTDFDQLQCLKYLPYVEPFPHQIETANRVLNQMRGRAILADEVGLGKTIEAGLIMKEYMVRGLAKKILILVPASLVIQWTKELNQKFGISAMPQKKEYMWRQYDVVVASIDTAKRDPHRRHVLDIDYDMLIIDEAHKLKNKRTKNYQFVKEIKKKYCLLLTATPIQNEMDELYNLINLLRPGHLGHTQSFSSTYVDGKRQAKNSGKLQKEIKKIMIRNRRSDGGVHFTPRRVQSIPIELSPEERALYDGVTHFVKERYQQETGKVNALALLTLQREVCSSREAAFMTLYHMHQKAPEDSPKRAEIMRLVDMIKQIETHSKAAKTVELLKKINDKVIIFTEYRATQNYLQKYLSENGITSVPFRGGFKRSKKDWMTDLFQNRAQVLIATEAGGEGINLQFCNHVINYDLPWNPMRIEQRIGRVHRLGQTKDVFIYNLSTTDTIEEHILRLLYEKIDLFEMVIGELDDIVERLALTKSLEQSLVEIIMDSRSNKEMALKMDNMGSVLRTLRQNTKELQNHPQSLSQS